MKRFFPLLMVFALVCLLGSGCVPSTPETMTPKVERKIKQAYIGDRDIKEENISVTCIYIFPKAYAVKVRDVTGSYAAIMQKEVVNGQEFNYQLPLQIYHGKTLYSLTKAFELGIVSAEDVNVLHNCYLSDLDFD